MNKTDRAAKTETAFRLFDKNKDGFITREEFTKVGCTYAPFPSPCLTTFCFQVSKKLNSTQIEAVFAKFDSNGDGRLSMDEFKQLMEKR